MHAVTVQGGAGRHDARPRGSVDIALVPLPPCSPELDEVERIRLTLRERFLSLRVQGDTDAIIAACCDAWNALVADPDRIRSLCAYPWITKVCA